MWGPEDENMTEEYRGISHAMRPEDLGIGNLFERVRDAVIVADAKTERIVLWNPAAANVFGYSIPEALKLRVEALVPGYLKDQHRTGMARYGETGRGAYIDSRTLLDLPAVRKDGEEIHIELSLNPIGLSDEADGEGSFVLTIVRDATERKRAEEEAQRSAERLRGLAEAAFEGILITDGARSWRRTRPCWTCSGTTLRRSPASPSSSSSRQSTASWRKQTSSPVTKIPTSSRV